MGEEGEAGKLTRDVPPPVLMCYSAVLFPLEEAYSISGDGLWDFFF